MGITKVEITSSVEDVFEKEIAQAPIKQHFTIKQLDAQILATQAKLDSLKKDRTDALALTTEEPK
jgi:hypothetical protein